MQKVLVVFTGGTIGSKKNDRTINVDQAAAYHLIETYHNSVDSRNVQFDTIQPLNTLSENIAPGDWMTLINSLRTMDFDSYQGIVVTHGSDTLAFTAACLSYAFNGTSIPIVLTASNYPLDDERSNGLRNFAGAVDLILDGPLPGVFVVFENNRGEAVVHLGTRLIQADPFTDQFDSPYGLHFGRMVDHKLRINRHPINPDIEQLAQKRPTIPFERLGFSSGVVCIKPFPGLNYQYYDFTRNKPQAVLHGVYHSGTASARDNDAQLYSLTRFIGYCKDHGVPLYISPLKNVAGDLYSSSVQLLQAGAIALENISTEAALVKLMLAYGSFDSEREIKALMQGGSLFFEHTGTW
ncbi:asparaginase [Paenibacillus xerothermodurans]|uniref:asparaginase n=1 Tax=Paenibacillus xerothermodurans TaxID=1977292 RepID=A0A2W1NS26_PAEXE|nr:asparaginase domain-containing protein [Paenibacillus xerothermodurans]PZE20556.1 asparaginase [Paenibacillus xerothermodurans]